ncbi:hypothetical protein B9Z55_005716 [Caenorhabditis nigoni]|uniref:SXP/RAL-2 family protein Ani s 5-like cation-binding domain-containing protein n=1 Tax=Caenorhabditis nigoni TaxID=1611254 RepID=A0A2G5V226_9PELO|nr:hypothetical protein B9Z55_005716 [Caenorhabditis nigoni]
MRFLLLLFVPALVHGFSSSFNYGCQNGKCTFQLVVPKEVAQYINENTLSSEISQIASDIGKLNNTITNFSDSGATNFTTLFNSSYSTVNDAAQSLNTNVNAALQNSTDLVDASANANATANLLYNSMACFKNTTAFSYTCFTLPTTVAPATTPGAPASTTENPSTGDFSTVTGGSTVTVIGGSTVPGGSTVSQPSGASTPSTSAGDASTSAGSVATSPSASTASAAASTVSTHNP